MSTRPAIPEDLKRRVLIEAGHRCAIPTCRYNRVEIVHIIAWREAQVHEFNNLIALCPNCHDLYDKDKKISTKEMQIYKANLSLLNSRYMDLEKKILEIFVKDSSIDKIKVPGSFSIVYSRLVEDKLFTIDDQYISIISINGFHLGPSILIITDLGKELVVKIRNGETIL